MLYHGCICTAIRIRSAAIVCDSDLYDESSNM
jgi:hypothetical protein